MTCKRFWRQRREDGPVGAHRAFLRGVIDSSVVVRFLTTAGPPFRMTIDKVPCVPPCPLWLNLYRHESENLHRISCRNRSGHRTTCPRVPTRSRRSRAPQQSGLRLHEPAALREGTKRIPAGFCRRFQIYDSAPERGRGLPEPAEDRRSQSRLRRRTQTRPEKSQRLV